MKKEDIFIAAVIISAALLIYLVERL